MEDERIPSFSLTEQQLERLHRTKSEPPLVIQDKAEKDRDEVEREDGFTPRRSSREEEKAEEHDEFSSTHRSLYHEEGDRAVRRMGPFR